MCTTLMLPKAVVLLRGILVGSPRQSTAYTQDNCLPGYPDMLFLKGTEWEARYVNADCTLSSVLMFMMDILQ